VSDSDLDPGQNAHLTLPRLDPDGRYVEVDPEITVEAMEAEIRDLPYEFGCLSGQEGHPLFAPRRGMQDVDIEELCRRVRGKEDLRPAVMKALCAMYPDVKTA